MAEHSELEQLRAEVERLKERGERLHRRAQAAESKCAKTQNDLNTWKQNRDFWLSHFRHTNAALAAERAAHAETAKERDAFARFLWNRLTAHDSDERAKKMIEVHAKMYPMWGRFLAVLASMRAQPQEQQEKGAAQTP